MPDWELHPVPADLAARYRAEGAWDDRSLGQFLDDCLNFSADQQVRIWSKTRPYTGPVSEIHAQARRLASGLQRLGIKPGDPVAFQLPNWVEAPITFYALSMLGVVLVPIVHFYGPKEVGFILRQSGAKAMIVVEGFGSRHHRDDLATIEDGIPSLEHIIVVPVESGASGAAVAARHRGDRAFADVLDADPLPRPLEVDPDAPAVIGYTSGTTADPKGVIHTHRSLGFETRQLAEHQDERDRPSLTGAPVGHAIGMLSGLLTPIYRGFAFYLIDVWDPATVLAATIEGDVNAGSGSTYFFTSLLDDPTFRPEHLDHMRMVGLGGSPVPDAVADRAESLGISLVRAYGCTEHPSVTGSKHSDAGDKRRHTDGRPLPFVELRLLGEDGREVAAGQPGEILTRGPDRFAGYTDAALSRGSIERDGWFHTGDVGILDADGYLTITDRVKDIIIRGGENVSAAEVEQLLATMDGVAEVAVVAAPDERLGEHGCAFLRMRAGAEEPRLDDLRRHLEQAGLARQKWPEELRIADELPRTPSGKVQKFVLRDRLRAGS